MKSDQKKTTSTAVETSPIAQREEEIQKFWQDHKIFEKTLEATKDGPAYSFYDGPPFATGLPHYGHMVASLMKDVVPRFWTMRGHYVERRWGWDCHGLPIENIVEKELGFKSKKDIEDYGIANFNEYCRSKVLGYVEEWKKTIPRFGRWADMDVPYKTMDFEYMESIWWVFKQLWDKGLVYEGHKSMHICPRCETTLSQFEVSEGYRDIEDTTATWKFPVVGQSDTYLLAWTTVPWSTLSTMGLAVGPDFTYVKVKVSGEHLIFIKDQLEKIMAGITDYEVVEEFLGSAMVGWEYEPLVDFYKSLPEVKNSRNVYHVVAADYVEASEGTGIVTINGSYGEIDLLSAEQNGLPVVMDVEMDGTFADIAQEYAGLYVKDAQEKFIVDMQKKNLVWKTEKYTHSYPHCWRCDTPLLNYSTSSWFVKVTGIKPRALELAQGINWSPNHIKEGRFGKWLEGARDWSISRQRFWASVIPIWQCGCGEMKVLGSAEELYRGSLECGAPITKIIFVRHGEAENNISHINSNALDKYPLTKNGIKQIGETTQKIKEILNGSPAETVIFSSPVLRTRESADLISQGLNLKYELANELKEVDFGIFEDQPLDKLMASYDALHQGKKWDHKFGESGESEKDVQERMSAWLEKTVKANRGKTIIVVSHGDPLMALINKLKGKTEEEAIRSLDGDSYIKKGEVRVVYVMSDSNSELDLHKHIVDTMSLKCDKCGQEMKRVSDVLDTWFDSGSMPYAQQHYPYDNKEKFEKSFPAQFIAEGVDQCRAWFYYLHVNSTSIMDKIAYQNVIANGIVLSGDGKKMSKKLGNYTEPEIIMSKYGADALRYYLLTSPVMQAENLNFDDNGVKEAMQKIVMLLNNILNFYKLYERKGDKPVKLQKQGNILDQWLMSKFNLLVKEVTLAMEAYDLPRAVRPFSSFVDEFSTWWLRRSRDRFKGDNKTDKEQALMTFQFVLSELAKVLAPFTPYIAEHIYQETGGQLESVHLEQWPEVHASLIDEDLLSQMEQARKIIEQGLSARAEAGIKIRQPLLSATAFGYKLSEKSAAELLGLIKDELNVKNITLEKGAELKVKLDTNITPELKAEGMLRELIRTINDLRKKQGLTVGDTISVRYQSVGEVIGQVIASEKMLAELKKSTISQDLLVGDNDGGEHTLNGETIKLAIAKI
ncbi:MAG: class I tRNA ligase family protein [Patescibacteria group bacterium]